MKKTLLTLASVVLLTPMLGASVTASAASWHNGTPKAMRGKYQAKIYQQSQGFGDEYHITAHTYIYQASNMPQMKATKLRYKKIKAHTWRLKGHIHQSGMLRAGKLDMKIYRKGKSFAAVEYGDAFTKLNRAKRVTAFH